MLAQTVYLLLLPFRLTMAQQRPAGGPPVPGQERTSTTAMGIDVGSRFASQLGFEGLKAYDDDSTTPAVPSETPSSPTSKKKKKKRHKKKEKQAGKKEANKSEKETDGSDDDDDGSGYFSC